jgi:hypothetical protein
MVSVTSSETTVDSAATAVSFALAGKKTHATKRAAIATIPTIAQFRTFLFFHKFNISYLLVYYSSPKIPAICAEFVQSKRMFMEVCGVKME